MKFSETPLGYHAKINANNSNFINKVNAFWTWQYDLQLWNKIGRPDPFDDCDISIVQLFKANMGIQ